MSDEQLLQDDMSQVPSADDAVPEGQYHLRVKSVKITPGAGTNGANSVFAVFAVQTEGPAFGRTVTNNYDLGDQRGLSNLKTAYKAVGYNPGPEGHNPMRLIDGELRATVKHNIKDGVTYANLVPWSVKPLIG